MTGNADQIEYWNKTAGETWATLQDRLDAQLSPLGLKAMEALALQPGEAVLDVGCGAGQTSLQLAQAVSPGGQVLGVDVSRPMLEVARSRGGAANVRFEEGDAQTFAFPAGGFDAAYSRFGVMFFADPPAAFVNIRKSLKPGGRLAFVCWRAPAENPFMTLPMAVAAPLLPPAPPPVEGAPGPFAFADPERVRAVLGQAGFQEVTLTPHDQKIGAGGLEETLSVSLKVGPLGSRLREAPEMEGQVVAAIRAALEPHQGPDGVKLDSATWIVTARA